MPFQDMLDGLKAPGPVNLDTDEIKRFTLDFDGLDDEQVAKLCDALAKNNWIERLAIKNCRETQHYQKLAAALQSQDKGKNVLRNLVFFNSTVSLDGLRALTNMMMTRPLEVVVLPAFDTQDASQTLFKESLKTNILVMEAAELNTSAIVPLTTFIKKNPQLKQLILNFSINLDEITHEESPQFKNPTQLIDLFKDAVKHPKLTHLQISCIGDDEKSVAAFAALAPHINEGVNLHAHTMYGISLEELHGNMCFILHRESAVPSAAAATLSTYESSPEQVFFEQLTNAIYGQIKDLLLREYDEEDDANNEYQKLLAQKDTLKQALTNRGIGSRLVLSEQVALLDLLKKPHDTNAFAQLLSELRDNKAKKHFLKFIKEFENTFWPKKDVVPKEMRTGPGHPNKRNN